jgi:hypothetical protein
MFGSLASGDSTDLGGMMKMGMDILEDMKK